MLLTRHARLSAALLAALVLLAPAGCRAPARSYSVLGAHVSPFKEQFNADAGKTRILLLPAPT